MYDAGSDWVNDRVGFVLGIITDIKSSNSSPGQLFAKIKGMNNRNKRTRANLPHTALVLDSGATIYFFSNKRMMKSINDDEEPVKIRCWGTM